MGPFDAILEITLEGIGSACRWIWNLPTLPAHLREARRHRREAEARAQADREATQREVAARATLIGRTATVVRPLKRSGVVEIEGRTYDAMSEHGFVDAGTPVILTRWDGRSFRVIAAPETRAAADRAAATPPTSEREHPARD